MPIGPYTSFVKAAGHLVSRYHNQRPGDPTTRKPIPPVVCILYGMVEGYAAIPDAHPHSEPFPGIILSHIADTDGPVPECQGSIFTIQTPPSLVHADVNQGDSVIIETLITIQTPGIGEHEEWPIRYHQEGIEYHFRFSGSLYYQKLPKGEDKTRTK